MGTPCIVLNNKTGKVFWEWQIGLMIQNMIVRANSLSEVLEKLKRTTIWEHKKIMIEKNLLNYFEKIGRGNTKGLNMEIKDC